MLATEAGLPELGLAKGTNEEFRLNAAFAGRAGLHSIELMKKGFLL
jgi:hypothetical protein